MMMGYGYGFGGAAGLLGGLGGILLLVGLVILVVWAVSRIAPAASGVVTPAQPDALGLLRERFARGEITEAEFAEAKRVLGFGR